jgi:hypothetical protein
MVDVMAILIGMSFNPFLIKSKNTIGFSQNVSKTSKPVASKKTSKVNFLPWKGTCFP